MEPTHNRVTRCEPTPIPASNERDVASVLTDAGVYVAKYGAHVPASPRDNYDWSRDRTHPATSDVGAIALVVYGKPVQMPPQDGSPKAKLIRRAVNAWVDWLEEYYGDGYEPTDTLGLSTGLCKAAHRWEIRHHGHSWLGEDETEPGCPVTSCTEHSRTLAAFAAGHEALVEADVIAARLRDAGTYLRRYGWIQGAYYDMDAPGGNPAACLAGAIAMVCYGEPVQSPALMWDKPGFVDFDATVSYLDATLRDECGQDDVYTWNDDRDRTVEEVLHMLSEVADLCEGDSTLDGAR